MRKKSRLWRFSLWIFLVVGCGDSVSVNQIFTSTKDLDRDELVGCCMFNKAEYFFSTSKMMQIQMIYIKQRFRNYKLVKQLIESVKKVSEDLPIVLSITSGLGIDPVFQMLGFENMGGNWRLM